MPSVRERSWRAEPHAAKARGACTGGRTCKHRRCELAHLQVKPHGDNLEQRDEPTDELGADIDAKTDNGAGAELFAISAVRAL